MPLTGAHRPPELRGIVGLKGKRVLAAGRKAGTALVAVGGLDLENTVIRKLAGMHGAGVDALAAHRALLGVTHGTLGVQAHGVLGVTLQRHPKYAVRLHPQRPVCDSEKCTMCGECVNACPVHACELSDNGIFKVEAAYCNECGACLAACGEHALAFEPYNASELRGSVRAG